MNGRRRYKHRALTGLILSSLLLAGCAAKNPTDPRDPYEKFNRAIFSFNMGVDKAIFRPLAKTYRFITPTFVKRGVNNFFSNINDVNVVANDVLQAKVSWALSDFWRLVINTTVGVGGLFDVASKIGLPKHKQDLGVTFARWGYHNSDYIMVPFFGPSTMRDAISEVPNFRFLTPWFAIKPESLRYSLWSLDIIRRRAILLPADKLVDQAFDPYVFVRNAYLQSRQITFNKALPKHLARDSEDTFVEGNSEDTFVAEHPQQDKPTKTKTKSQKTAHNRPVIGFA